MEFRLLRADEIECRVATIRKNGLALLLYKDARCDQNILDETVGAMNWQRHHNRDNANCIVSIWDSEKKQWIEKEDTGTESYTEKEKGLASDSFKRACFNWGIGRELYTAPFMWVKADECKIEERDNRCICNDRFEVKEIEYEGRKISLVKITNTTLGNDIVFTHKSKRSTGSKSAKPKAAKEKPAESTPGKPEETANKKIDTVQAKSLRALCQRVGIDEKAICEKNKIKTFDELTVEQMMKLKQFAERKDGENR